MTERTAAKDFRDLRVWQQAHEFVLGVYKLSEGFPKAETYGLTAQLRRAAVSVPANIAEGFRRRGKADKVRVLNIAHGSLEECRYYSILAKDLGYGPKSDDRTQQVEDVSKMLTVYSNRILSSVF